MSMASRRSKKDKRNKDRLPKRLFKRERAPAIPAIPPGSRVLYEPTGREKMSEVLEDFIEPYQELTHNEDSFRKLLNLGILAWNAALLPEDQRQTAIDETLRAGLPGSSEADLAVAREFIETLVRRKLEQFAANQRVIISFELTDTGNGYHVMVASTL
jgi:hypothetical protein